MVSDSPASDPSGDSNAAADTNKRIRSSIEFPYSDLDSAIDIAQTINDRAGASCEVEQLAGWLNQAPSGGTFRSRLSAARIFGLVETERGYGRVALKDLGREIIDSIKGPAARATAFLTVPLYSEMYDQYKSYALPPAAAIERQMIALGVSPKQADRARQSFTKSAQQAGFIDGQTGRFIKPGFSTPPLDENAGSGDVDSKKNGGSGGGGGGGDNLDLHPFIVGLLQSLPEPNTKWAKQKRKKWLTTAAGIFDLIYENADGDVDDADPDKNEQND